MDRYNRNTNPALDNNTAGWVTGGTKAALRRVATTRPDGIAGFIGDARSNGAAVPSIFTDGLSGMAAVAPGQTYTMSVYVYHGAGSTKAVRLYFECYSGLGTGYTGTPNMVEVPVANNTMTRLSVTGTAPAGSAYARTLVQFTGVNVDNTYVAVACAMVEDGPTSSNYRDGNSPGWMWYGAAGSSVSSETTFSKTGSDSGSGADSPSLSAQMAGADSGTGTEAGYIAVPRTGSDSGTGADTAGTLSGTVTGTDTGAGDPGIASIGATTTGADTGAGAETPHIGADTLAAPDAGAGSEHGHIVLPGGDTATGAEQLVDLTADTYGADTARGAAGGYAEGLLADLAVSIFAVTDDGPVPLPDYQQLTLAPTRNGPGSITLTYPVAGLNFDLLRENTVGDDRDLEVEIWTIGSPLGALRGYLQEGSGDDVKEGAGGSWQFTGGFLELRMAEAIVYPQPLVGETTLGEDVEVLESSVTPAQWSRLYALGYRTTESEPGMVRVPQKVIDAVRADQVDIPVLADPKREAKFEAATPGAIMLFLLGQAWARGALTDLTTSFTGAADTGGTEWPALLSTQISPGTGYDAILGLLVELGRAEWSVSWTGAQPCLNLWVAGDRGVDRSVGARPVVLRAGRNLAEAPRKWSVRSSPTAMLGIGAEGFYADTFDLDAQTRRGRRIETSASSQNLADGDAVLAYAQRRLETSADGTLEVTVGLALLADEPRPAVAFDVGDWALAAFGTGLDAYRIVEWSLSIDASRQMSATATLNDSFTDELVRQRQQLDAITSGSAVVGTSEPPEDRGVPAAPTGVVVGSEAFLLGAEVRSSVLVGWAAVEINTDGSAATDIESYRVEWALASIPDVWLFGGDVVGSPATFTTGPGLPIRVRVQARDRNGNRSEWCPYVEHTTEDDLTPPPVASAPVCSNFLGTLRIAWDGLTDTGADMQAAAADFDRVEVHVDPGSQFTPTTETRVGELRGHGEWVVTDLPYDVTQFVRLVAVDNRGNRADPSEQGSATPGKVVGDDVFAGAIGTAQLANAAVKTAQIDNLAVNDAKIGNVSMGKVTAGSIAASMIFTSGGQIGTRPPGATGSGWTGDSAGIRFYDSAGNETIRLAGATGDALLTGVFQTGRTGRRVLISGADQAITFYPSAGETRVGKLFSFVPTNYPSDIAIQLQSSLNTVIDRQAYVQALTDSVRMSVRTANTQNTTSHLVVLDDSVTAEIYDPVTVTLRSLMRIGETTSSRYFQAKVNPGGGLGTRYTSLFGDTVGWAHLGGVLASGAFHGGFTYDAPAGYAVLRGDVGAQVSSADGNSPRPINASDFFIGSSVTLKEEFAPLPESALQVLRGAPVTRWRRIDAAEGAQPQVGPVAEDLPEWAVIPPGPPRARNKRLVRDERASGPDERATTVVEDVEEGPPQVESLGLSSMVGLVWDAVRELDAELDEIRAERGRPTPKRRRTAETLADARSGRYRNFTRTKGNNT